MSGARPTRPTAAGDAPDRVRTRTCRHCGAMFEVVRELQRFCQPSCRLAHCRRTDADPRLPLADLDDLFREPFE